MYICFRNLTFFLSVMCGWVWPFFDWVWVGVGSGWGQVWVSVTIFWLSVAFGWVWVDMGEYGHFFAGCGWVWVSVTFFGWVWVSVVGNSCHWVRSMKREYRNFPFLHNIILKQNYIVTFILLPLWKSVRIILDYINVFLDPQYIVSQEDF